MTFVSSLGALGPSRGSESISPSSSSHVENRHIANCRDRAVDGLGPGVEQIRDERLHQIAVEGRGVNRARRTT